MQGFVDGFVNFFSQQQKNEKEVLKDGNAPDVQTLNKILANIEEYIPTPEKDQEVIMLFGRTKEGKSTSGNILAGHNIIISKSGGRLHIQFKAEGNGTLSDVGKEAISVTTLPYKLIGGKNKNIIFVDFPGFGDRRGAIQSLLNAFYIQRYFQIYKKCKFLFVNSYPSLDGDATKFIENCDFMAEFMSKMPEYKNHMGFIMTRTDSYTTSEDIQTELKENILAVKEKLKLKKNISELIEYMSKTDKITVLPKPDKIGLSHDHYRKYYSPFVDDVDNIVTRKIQQNITNPIIHLSLTPKENQEILKEVPPVLIDIIEKYFISFYKLIEKHYTDLYNQSNITSTNKPPEFKNGVITFNKLLKFQRDLISVQSNYTDDIGKQLKKCFQNNNFIFINQDLINQIIAINFFKTVIPQIENSLYKELSLNHLEKINQRIKEIMNQYKQSIFSSYKRIIELLQQSYLKKVESYIDPQKDNIKYSTNIINNFLFNSYPTHFNRAMENLSTNNKNQGLTGEQFKDIDLINELNTFMGEQQLNYDISYNSVQIFGQQQKKSILEIINSDKRNYEYGKTFISQFNQVDTKADFYTSNQKDHATLCKENSQYFNKIKSLEQQHKDQNQLLVKYQNSEGLYLKEIEDLKTQNYQITSEQKNKIQSHNQNNDAQEQKIKDLQKDLDYYMQIIQNQEVEKDTLRKGKTEKEVALQVKDIEITTIKDDFQGQKSSIQNLQQQIQEKEQFLENLRREKEQLEQQLQKKQSACCQIF